MAAPTIPGEILYIFTAKSALLRFVFVVAGGEGGRMGGRVGLQSMLLFLQLGVGPAWGYEIIITYLHLLRPYRNLSPAGAV